MPMATIPGMMCQLAETPTRTTMPTASHMTETSSRKLRLVGRRPTWPGPSGGPPRSGRDLATAETVVAAQGTRL